VTAGLQITYSVTGEAATTIESYFYRLVCENGMVHRECVSAKAARTRRLPVTHANARELQLDQVRRLAVSEWSALTAKLESLHRLNSKPLDVLAFFRRSLERARLRLGALLALLEAAWQCEGGQATAWGAMNALTRVATHERNLPHRTRRVLAGLAGILAFRDRHVCPRCFSYLAGAADDMSTSA
jgi:hypothetical protein